MCVILISSASLTAEYTERSGIKNFNVPSLGAVQSSASLTPHLPTVVSVKGRENDA